VKAGRRLPARVNLVLRFDPARAAELRSVLAKGSFRLGERPHAVVFARREGVTLTAYASGKLLLTGPQAAEFAGVLAGLGLAREEAAPPPAAPADFAPHAGSDESGKGDYFGPLCVATVHVPDAATAKVLVDAGVRDSKTVGLRDAGPLASLVRARCPHATVVLPPRAYNDLYERVGNLNALLAWAHARAIEDLLAEVGPVPVVVDQFARGVLPRHLMEKGRRAHVTEVVRGEADVAVAAASLVARAEFLAGMAALEARVGHPLPRGAGPAVAPAARRVVAERGAGFLREVAKLHFATTAGVLGGPAPPSP